MAILATPRLQVDFGNCDEDGAVRLMTRGALESIAESGIELVEGMTVSMTDDELLAEGVVTFRDGMWVAIVSKWLPIDGCSE